MFDIALIFWIALGTVCLAIGFVIGAISTALVVGYHRNLPDTDTDSESDAD